MLKKNPPLLFPIGLSSGLIVLFLLLVTTTAHAQTADDSSADSASTLFILEGWLPFATLSQGLADPGVAAVGTTLHIVGGQAPEGPTDLHVLLDLQTRSWSHLPALPVPRSDATTAVFNDTLYVFGGYNMWYGGAISYTHKYHIATQSWVTATAMATPISGAASAIIDGEIYIFGGFDNISETSSVQSYNPGSDSWTVRAPMPLARSEFDAVVLDDLIYLIGGNIFSVDAHSTHVQTDTTTISATVVSVYNPATDEWTEAAPLPEPRVDASSVVRKGKIYVSGGTDRWLTGTVQQDVFIYDPQTDSWRRGPQMRNARGGHRSSLVDDKLYVIGGYGTNDFPMDTVNILDTIAATIYLPLVSKE